MTSHFSGLAKRVRHFSSWLAVACVFASTLAMPAGAAIEVRVEARPASDPIQAFVRVTDDGSGDPVEGLDAGDFTVLIDGSVVTIGGFALPPSQDDAQKVTVVFAMDYSESVTGVALAAMQQAVIDFSNAMEDGDVVAIIKFNNTNPAGASVVLPFTEIDHAVNNDAIEAAVLEDYPGNGTNILDALEVAVSQFITPPTPLPDGPKAIVILSDGDDNASDISQSEVVAVANANSIQIPTIGVGGLSVRGRSVLLTLLGNETGGEYLQTSTEEDIAEAYASISLLLSNEYLITIPTGIEDCETHAL